jgi:hypothetical protein
MVETPAEKEGQKTFSINFTKKEADMFLAMTTETAAKGPSAYTLASLHAMAQEASDALK